MSPKFYFYTHWRGWFKRPFNGGRFELFSFQFDWIRKTNFPFTWEITIFGFIFGGSIER